MKKIIVIFLALLPVVGVRAQIVDDEGLYVDTVFHDHINRQAEDFVKAYLCTAEPTDWRDDFLGVNGHAFIRLVCDAFGMDYCFSYESESVNGQMDNYLRGKLKMGMFAIPTEEYLVDYQKWNRAVHQYKLNLPPDVKQRLWEIMDNRVMEGDQLKLDLNRRGCAITVIRYVKRALGEIQIAYPSEFKYKDMTRREILYQNMEDIPWVRLMYGTLLYDSYKKEAEIDEKLILPSDLAEIWQQSTLLGKPLIEYDQDIVDTPKVEVKAPLVTPLRLAWLWLIVTLVLALLPGMRQTWPNRINAILLLSLQTLLGLVLIYLALFTQMFSTAAGILMIFFNPLPAICWKWRRYWQLPMAVIYLVTIIILFAWPHMVVDPAFLVMGLCYVVLFAAEPVCKRIYGRGCQK